MMVIPIVVLSIYLFSYVYIFRQDLDQQEVLRQSCYVQLHAWLPLLSTWWLAIFINNYCVDGLKELLKIYSTNRTFLIQKICCVIAYDLYTVAFFGIIDHKLGFGMTTLLQILLEIAAVDGIFLVSFFLSKNVGAAMLVVVVYSIFLNFFDIYHYIDVISIFPTWDEASCDVVKKMYKCIGIFVGSIPFWLIPVKTK